MKKRLKFEALESKEMLTAPTDSWGALTRYAIHEVDGWDQGLHSSDPSGDGRGPEGRVGLANVVERGNLAATTNLIASILNS